MSRRLVAGVRKTVKRLLPPASRRWLREVSREHVHAIVESSGPAGAFAMFGNPRFQAHFERVYLESAGSSHLKYRPHPSDWSQTALGLARQHGLVVVSELELPAALESRALRVPRFVGMTVDLGESESAFMRNLPESARSDIRKVRREGFGMEVHRDVDWVPEFYHRYHRPAITGRHGQDGYVMSIPEMSRLVINRGHEFLCVTQGGRRVAALLAEPDAGGYRMGRIGWLDADPELIRRGVLGAVYWFAMQRARELGLRRLRMGGTPPYLEDGVFRFKMKWGAAPDPDDTLGGVNMMRILLGPKHPRARALVAKSSVITLNDEGQFVVCSARRPEQVLLSEPVRQGLVSWYDPTNDTGTNA